MNIQPQEELERFYSNPDPWEYERNPEDEKRQQELFAALPTGEVRRTLDIGCGNGFITRRLPGKEVVGVDISANAIRFAQERDRTPGHSYLAASFFDLEPKLLGGNFDLIVITGVLYPQYIGNASLLAYQIVDRLLETGGTLATVHILEWSRGIRFPYLLDRTRTYSYREYIHLLNIYIKGSRS